MKEFKQPLILFSVQGTDGEGNELFQLNRTYLKLITDAEHLSAAL